MATYTVVVQEFKNDREVLDASKYNLQVAKSVSTGEDDTEPQYNVVYQSKFLAPRMTISWSEDYALNWVQTMPTDSSVKVKYGE